jgi:hypothetical protein
MAFSMWKKLDITSWRCLQTMKPLSPDKRAGLSVTGLLLVLLAVVLCAASCKVNGLPQWPLRADEVSYFAGAVMAGLLGVVCMFMGTEESSKARK